MINRKIFQLAISLGLLPLCANAEMCCPLVPGEPICGEVPPGYFYPALYETCGCLDIAVSADFIYWAASKQVNSFAIENRAPAVGVTENVLITHRFGYRPGFKVGAALGLRNFDNILIQAEYLRFNNSTTTGRTAPAGAFITPLNGITINVEPASQVRSKWHINAQWLEVLVGRPFYLGQRMILTPSLGLKGFWFHETQNVDFNLLVGGLGTERNDFKFWSIGPILEMSAKGLLCGGLYLLSNWSCMFPYTRYTKNDFQANFPLTVPFQRDFFVGKRKPYTYMAFFEAGVGLGWGTYFCGYHLELDLTYDYWGAWILNTIVFGGQLSKDRYLHGLTLKGQFDF
ncbi:MAG: hypothetical protein JSS30_08230 [Verrucomicrobia bacterium]|nr:hypothetical protein [Verrucomicrobiota bacterium]